MSSKAEVIAVINDRAMLYRVIAGLYFNTLTDEQIEAFAGQDLGEVTEYLSPEIASGFDDMRRFLRRRHSGTRQELAMEFTQCFLGTHTYKGMTAAPYESLYRDSSGVLMGKYRTEVYNIYKKECVALEKGKDYAEDHLSFEMEFLAILCDRCIAALEAGDNDEALRILDVQEQFLNKHILVWFPRFRNLTTKFLETRFYRGVIKVTNGFLTEEPAIIADLRNEITSGFVPSAAGEDETPAAGDAPEVTSEEATEEE